MTKEYFIKNKDNGPEFLWNAKPRFGKTLTTYDLCKQLEAKTILIVTNRPAIATSWYNDYVKFLGTESDYYFISEANCFKKDIEKYKHVLTRKECLNKNPTKYIEFVSLQDIKGSKEFGGDYNKLKHIAEIPWDLLVIDEAHEGVDTDKTDFAFEHIERKYTLHLSGTPFKALASGKFKEEEIFNWTYVDEQRAKEEWDKSNEEENPYRDLPRMNLYTYKMSDIIEKKVEIGVNIDGENFEYCFDLNEFFACKPNANGEEFIHDEDVDKFLDSLTTKEKFPFSTKNLREKLNHTFWLLDRVDSAKALAKKLEQHTIFKEYKIVLAAGNGTLNEEEKKEDSFNKVRKAIENNNKTITLSVGQLTTGITIPEWSAVLILSNVKSPELYMQTAFRVQNPYKFPKDNKFYKKENCYVFDFDPARTLTILESFANNLGDKPKNDEERKKNIAKLLNFFSVYGEDENGKMIELDSKRVLSIPREIHSIEVVKRGFMCNYLFQNIAHIFKAPKEILDIINNFEPVKQQKGKNKGKDINISQNTKQDLNIDDNGKVTIEEKKVIGIHTKIFGDKIYKTIEENINEVLNNIETKSQIKTEDNKEIKTVIDKQFKEFKENIVPKIKEEYTSSNITIKNIDKIFDESKREIGSFIDKKYKDFEMNNKINENRRKTELDKAKNQEAIDKINVSYDNKKEEIKNGFIKDIKEMPKIIEEKNKDGIKKIETIIKEKEKTSIENDVKDHLRGFTRTIPSFLMAYGDSNTTLENFDKIIPDNVFKDVTSINLEQFRKLRDGGEYMDEDTGKLIKYDGFFDPIVFNDSINEFLKLKDKFSNYFDENNKEDIFDYIPPQKTNQIFTPKNIVKEMVDNLEKEVPGCFDDPNKTFIDLYMKSGLYITEIVKRLYASKVLKEKFPDKTERLRHIFEKQVFGLAATEILFNITKSYILGFDKNLNIKHNFHKLDTTQFFKDNELQEKLDEIFPN